MPVRLNVCCSNSVLVRLPQGPEHLEIMFSAGTDDDTAITRELLNKTFQHPLVALIPNLKNSRGC